MSSQPQPPVGWPRYFWWARSRKAQAAIVAAVASALAGWFGLVIPEASLTAAVAAIVSLILGIAHEDAAEKR